MAAISGRPDGRLSKYIYAAGLGGVIDHRPKYGAWDASSSEKASEVMQEVTSGEYRGREKMVFSRVFEGVATSSNSVGSSFHVIDADDNVTVGDKITVIDNGTVVLSDVVITIVTDDSLTWDVSDGTYSRVSGNTYYAVVSTETDITVEGEFTQTDVIGDPANILLTDALKDGWLGSWIPVIPDGTYKFFSLTRKNIDETVAGVYTSTYGDTWVVHTGFSYNSIRNGNSATLSSGTVFTYNYTASAKQTEQSENLEVLHGRSGLGEVFATLSYNDEWGCLLSESTLGEILTGNSDKQFENLTVLSATILPTDGEIVIWTTHSPEHYQLGLGSATNAMKVLPHQISENNQANLNLIANELIHDGTDWGDDSTMQIIEDGTYTNLNGDTCKAVIHKLAKPYGWIKNET